MINAMKCLDATIGVRAGGGGAGGLQKCERFCFYCGLSAFVHSTEPGAHD